MNFYKNGTKVNILGTEMTGTVIGVCIRGLENVTIEYHVMYMIGGNIHQEWLYSYLVSEYKDNRKQAGLVNYSTEIDIVK